MECQSHCWSVLQVARRSRGAGGGSASRGSSAEASEQEGICETVLPPCYTLIKVFALKLKRSSLSGG